MRKHIAVSTLLLLSAGNIYAHNSELPVIEVTGTATLNIIPDRISIEIGLEEYYKPTASGDSTIVKLTDIENNVRKTLHSAGIPDSMIFISDLGNYKNRDISSTFLMAERISATVSDFSQLEIISEKLDRNGITSFNITKTDNSDMSEHNRQGLEAALDAARRKAEFIAENEGLKIIAPHEITETTSEPAAFGVFSNVAYDSGSGMENMRRIVRRYSVKVRYLFKH
ncbi:MAG: SIMPL domain-containing protein [Paramuribaculum sp.]|nr:SIMPL domain-containing protein [Paramuribaculum sp.]